MKKYLHNLILSAQKINHENILFLLEKNKNAKVIDLGCDDGEWTMKVAKKIGTKYIYGDEVVAQRRSLAKKRGIITSKFDLNERFTYKDNFFDVIHSSEVIEHLPDTDNFVKEIWRTLKPGGYAVITTVNLSSWHNIFAQILGYQPFDLANISQKGTIGNPFSLWKNHESKNDLKSWQHMRLFSYFALQDLFKKFGFTVEKTKVAGYYPLPNFFSEIDPIHGHVIAIKVRKKKKSK